MNEQVIRCPSCKTEIKLTESLAAPLVESMRKQFEQQLAQKNKEIAAREETLRAEQGKIDQARNSIDEEVRSKLKTEREKIVTEEAKKARLALSNDLEQKTKEVTELQAILKDKDVKLTEAQQAQANLVRKERELEDAKRALDLTIETRVREAVDEQVNSRLKVEKEKITQEEGKKARLALSGDLEQKTKELTDLQAVLDDKNTKLAEAQKAQAELLRKERELEDAKRAMELTIETKVQESLTTVRDKAKRDAEEGLKLKVLEKESTISAMQQQIEELKRRAEQGSQQLQGEVQELELEALLRNRFMKDAIDPVPKGEHGGDVLHRIVGPAGLCGTILWESKRTKNWSGGWLSKLRDDQRAAKAEVAVIISQALPEEIETFGFLDGVWISEPRYAIPLAMCLRYSVIALAEARQAGEGQKTKMELVYKYLTGPQFRQRVEAVVEKFADMREDLDKERKMMTRQWAKREEQINCVTETIAGLYGDLQGIAGRSLQEIEGLALTSEVEETLAETEPRMLSNAGSA